MLGGHLNPRELHSDTRQYQRLIHAKAPVPSRLEILQQVAADAEAAASHVEHVITWPKPLAAQQFKGPFARFDPVPTGHHPMPAAFFWIGTLHLRRRAHLTLAGDDAAIFLEVARHFAVEEQPPPIQKAHAIADASYRRGGMRDEQ